MRVVTIFLQMRFPLVLAGGSEPWSELPVPVGSAVPRAEGWALRGLHYLNSIPLLSLDILSP